MGNGNGLELQHKAIDEIVRNYDKYKGAIEDSFSDDNLENPGQNNRGWADHVMIQAIANLLHRDIEIRRFGLNGTENETKIIIKADQPEHPSLSLGNIANLHFVAAQADTAMAQEGKEDTSSFSDAATNSGVEVDQTPLKLSGEYGAGHEVN